MILSRSKIVIYLDLIVFLFAIINSVDHMLIGIISGIETVRPVIMFILVYMINLLMYRISINFYNHKLLKKKFFDFLLIIIATISIITILLFIIYLFFMAAYAMWGSTITQVLCNYITYATIVGSWVIFQLACDNMTSLYNSFFRNND